MIILSSRRTHHSVLGEYDDSIVRSADTDFVLSTDHTQALVTTQLGTLDLEFLIAVVEHAAHVGNNHFLASLHIRSATDNLLRSFSLTQVDSRQMQMRVRNILTRQHLSYIQAFQPALDTLYFFQAIDFEAARRQRCSHLFR